MARPSRSPKSSEENPFIEKLVEVRRVSKTVKGGRNMRFAAFLVVGDGKGRVGYGSGKAREVPEAIRKASEQARRNMRRVPLRNGKTLHHDTMGRFGAATVVLRAATPGTGIIAGGPMRAVFEALGIQDVVAKSLGTSNPSNMVKATFDAFDFFESPRMVSSRRNMKVASILGKNLKKGAENQEEENEGAEETESSQPHRPRRQHAPRRPREARAPRQNAETGGGENAGGDSKKPRSGKKPAGKGPRKKPAAESKE